MPRILRLLGLTLTLVLLPALAAQEKKPAAEKEKSPPKDKKEAVEKLVTGGEITGKLVHWEANQRYLTLQVTVRYGVPNLDAIKNLANMQVELGNAARRGDRNAVLDVRRRMAQEQNNLVSVKEETQSMEFQAAEAMKVRLATPPPVFDAKGKLRKPTAKELADMKGPNKSIPGYAGDLTDIRQDAIVTVSLPKKKAPSPTRPNPVNKDKDKDSDKPAPGTRIEAILLLIHGEVPRT